MNKRKVACITS